MTFNDYRIHPHAEIGELASQVYELTRLAFGAYPGVLQPSEAHRAWYVRRPGMDATLSQAALLEGRLVASLFVTVAQLRLGGRLAPVGIVDTVMTHPAHRRRGLARRLLTEAIAGMRARGLSASLLYTLPGSVPFQLYRSLGYRPHAPVHYLHRLQPTTLPVRRTVQRAGPADRPALIAFLNEHHAGHDGYIPIDEALWSWRRVERPPELPAATYLVHKEGTVQGCATLCRAPIVASGAGAASYVITDLALGAASDAAAVLDALLSPIPAGAEARILSAEANGAVNHLLRAAGFRPSGAEVGMVLPLDAEAELALAAPPARWYVLAESVIGV